MKLRTCSNFHFIQAIKDGLVVKICNVDSHGRPGLSFKKLEDILGIADSELPFQPLVDRNTRQRASESTKFCCNDKDDENNCDSDELFGEMTLQQLKKKCKTKKRKAAEPVSSTPKQEYCDLEPEDDDSDLKQPLSCLKSKLSNSLKPKKKRAKRNLSASYENALSLKHEQIIDAEDALQSTGDLSAQITVKVESQEAEYLDCENINSVTDTLICGVESGESFETVKGREPICGFGEVPNDHLVHSEPIIYHPWNGGKNMEVGHQELVRQQSPVLHASELKNEGDVNNAPLSLSFMETVSPDKNQSPSVCNSSQSDPYVQQYAQQVNNNIGVEVPDVMHMNENVEVFDATTDSGHFSNEFGHVDNSCISEDDDMNILPPNQDNCSLRTPINNICSTWSLHSCLSPEKEKASVENDSLNIMEKPLVTSTSADTAIDYLNSRNRLAFLEDASPMHEDKQPLVLVTAEAERMVCTNSYPLDSVSQHSSSEIKNYDCSKLQQTPERFPSTRKIISPSSQEKLCLAMNSSEAFDNIDLYKCKEKLVFEKEAVEKASLTDSDIKGGMATSCHPKGAEKVIRTKFTLNAKQILKKPKTDKKASPPRGCLEGPRLCRSLPRLSTGCTSVQAFSESAIAFSQRQMQDIESLAQKLMTELKSMKDIVEEKLLYESYRTPSLKNETDEVKVAIKTATKAEETAKKWLSMMARDCTRFCKIMKLTENDAPATENAIQDNTPQREKKISFADEAGGMLCNVKLFEDCVASQESRSEIVATI